ncbi:MAG: hypothetical protein K2W99_02370 [Chthoniobacterales bacterium]|nr:hypothetical protein [Chthoniobacterales bacterium]
MIINNILIKERLFLLIIFLFPIALFSKSGTINNKASSALIASLFEQAEEEKKEFHYQVALDCYEKILTINPYDKKAAKEIKILHTLKEDYNKETYEETKARMLLKVNQAWKETNTIKQTFHSSQLLDRTPEQLINNDMIAKLNSFIIPNINLENVSIGEAVDYLKQKSCEQDPLQKGINIFLKLPTSEITSSNPALPLITLQLNEVPLYVALDYVAREANLTMKLDSYAVALSPPVTSCDLLTVKEYEIPPHFFPIKEEEKEMAKKQTCYQVKEYFQSQGIEFSPDASANYLPAAGKLVVRANQDNLDLIDTLVVAAKKTALSQISIETKFIEVSDDQLKQLGLNWLLSPTQIGNSGIYAKGEGTTASLYPNNNPLVTEGLTSANSIIANNPIDAVINNGAQQAGASTSGDFNICGVYNTQQLQLIIKALHQEKGIDVMAAPHVTTRSGLKATVKIVDEFIYPTQYTPPQLPQSTTNSGSLLHQTPPTIAPAFPNSWATKNLGVILEAKPTIEPDECTINIELHPQIIDFDGFINYGTPINTIGYHFSLTNSSMVPFSSTLTTNTINQPVFTIREVTTSVKVNDGQTIILGGLIHEDIQKTRDKIPLLGDIPIAGRLFQSRATRKLKKNLIIFVTPKILHP